MAPTPLVPVWMDSWQYECCGESFAVGDRVRWTQQPADLEFLAAALGALLPDWHADVVRREALGIRAEVRDLHR